MAATVKPMDPFPKPLGALCNVIQLGVADADHEHVAGAVTVMVPVPPFEGNLVGETCSAAHCES